MGSIFQSLLEMGALVLWVALFVILSIACEAGFRIGRARAPKGKAAEETTSATATITGGMLALLAFMLGLTINFAQNRFEARRDMVAVEANAIGTAWLRAKLVGGAEGEAMASLIHDYAKTRLEFTRAPAGAGVDTLDDKTGEEQDQIWALATSVARKSPTPISASLIAALNDMIDSSLSQRFAFEGKVPGDMIGMLLAGSLLAIGALGYQLGLTAIRQQVLTSLLLVMWTGGMVMTIDLERPRVGDIRVETAPLEWTIKGFEAAPPSVPIAAPSPPAVAP